MSPHRDARASTDACGPRFCYRIYGLRLSANFELPGLVADVSGGTLAHVRVEMGILPAALVQGAAESAEPYFQDFWDGEEREPRLVVRRYGDRGCFHFAYDSGVEFVVDSAGGAIWARWSDDLGLADAVLYLVGPILGFLLRQRGITCLHAGAVVADRRALVLTGPSGAGKSTFTTLLARQGFPVLTEDVLPVVCESSRFLALPGYPRLRLRPDVVEHFYGRVDDRPRLTPNWERRYLDLIAEDLGFHAAAARLGAVYVLDRDDQGSASPLIEAVKGHEAMSLLAANTYRNDLLARDGRRDEFLFLADLIRRIPVRRVRLASGLSALERTAAQILADFRASVLV